MGGPGDRATKTASTQEPTPSLAVEGHGGDPNKVNLDRALLPGSKSTARSQMPLAREPGDLDGASTGVVPDRQLREGQEPQAAERAAEESDEAVVPKKPAKTWVTPVEPVEGRAEAKGKAAAGNASPAQDGNDALTHLRRPGKRAKENREEKFTNLPSHIK